MTVYGYIYSKTNNYEPQQAAIDSCEFAISGTFRDVNIDEGIPALDRPALKELKGILKKGDICIFVHMGCFGAEKMDILTTLDWFVKAGVKNRVLQLEGVDVTSTYGKVVVKMIACIREWEASCPVY